MSLCPGKFAAQHFGQLTQWNDRLWWLSSWLSKNRARIGLVENFTLIPAKVTTTEFALSSSARSLA